MSAASPSGHYCLRVSVGGCNSGPLVPRSVRFFVEKIVWIIFFGICPEIRCNQFTTYISGNGEISRDIVRYSADIGRYILLPATSQVGSSFQMSAITGRLRSHKITQLCTANITKASLHLFLTNHPLHCLKESSSWHIWMSLPPPRRNNLI